MFWVLVAAFFTRVPGPVEVVESLVDEFSRGEVFGNFGMTLYRFAVGVALATVVGIVVGVMMGLSPLSRAFFESPVLVGLSIPAIIWSFLTVMWFGFGDMSPIVTTFLTAVPVRDRQRGPGRPRGLPGPARHVLDLPGAGRPRGSRTWSCPP